MRDFVSIILISSFISSHLFADSFTYNTFNNHGVIGLINMPSARFYDEASFGITAYDGTPDQKITLTSFPYDWMEASFFYTNIQDKPYCGQDFDPVCKQDYKDKGFNFKLRVKEEGVLPAIAIGINDIAGTGFYSSEYLVASYGIYKTDFHIGIGWGELNGSNNFNNPLGYIYDGFNSRPTNFEDKGGQFQPSRYFSGKTASAFYGLSHVINDRLIFKIENDPRIIKGTNFMRNYSLDELPQLLNVVKGDMSLVGPRPLFEEDTNLFNQNYMRRLNVLPGITGLLQINERNTSDFETWYKYDIEYIENWSLYLDLKIIFKTPFALFNSKIKGI